MSVLGIVIALVQGIAVGSAAILVLGVLGIVSHSAAITGTRKWVRKYGMLVCAGALVGACAQLLSPHFELGGIQLPVAAVAGLFTGLFAGVVLSALVEILEIFPVITGKLRLARQVKPCVYALAAGKTLGVLVYYLTPYFKQS